MPSPRIVSAFRRKAARWVLVLALGAIGISSAAAEGLRQDSLEVPKSEIQEFVTNIGEGQLSLAITRAREGAEMAEKRGADLKDGKSFGMAVLRINFLAALYEEMGDLKNEIATRRRLLDFSEKMVGRPNAVGILVARKLHSVYERTGDLAGEEEMLLRDVEVYEAVRGKESSALVVPLLYLFHFYSQIGAKEKYEAVAARAYHLTKGNREDNPGDFAIASIIYGLSHLRSGQYEIADEAMETGMASLPENYMDESGASIAAMKLAAFAFRRAGRYAQAEALYSKAIELTKAQRDSGDIGLHLLAAHYYSRGLLYEEMGKSEQAKSDYANALSTSSQAKPMGEKPMEAAVSIRLARLKLLAAAGPPAAREVEEAAKLAAHAREILEDRLKQIVSFAPETMRMDHQQSSQRGMGNLLFLFMQLNDARAVAEIVLRTKGSILESLLEERRAVGAASKNAGLGVVWNQLKDARTQVRAALAAGAGWQEAATRFEGLERQVAALVTNLGDARCALTLKAGTVEDALPEQTALLEYFRFNDFQGKEGWTAHYGVFVLRHGAEPIIADCGPAEPIEQLVASYLQDCQGHRDEAKLLEDGRQLSQRLLPEKVAEALRGVPRWVVAPEGALNFVAYATLPNGAGMLAETHLISYAASGRDLLPQETAAARKTENRAAIFALPLGADTTDKNWTITEAENLERLFTGHGWKVALQKNDAASKPAVRSLDGPRFLHFATHGFYNPPKENEAFSGLTAPESEAQRRRLVEDPLLQSGLLLAGNRRDAAGQILTAAEAAELNLAGTEVATLAACKTAAGQERAGEGVLGLRRAFRLAGVRDLVLTLWSIDDDADNAALVHDFYERCLSNQEPAEALALAQREWLINLRKKHGVEYAVRRAGAFVLNSGRPRRTAP